MCGVVTISAETFHSSVHRICLQPTPHKRHCSTEKIYPLHCVWFKFLCGRMLVQCRYRVNELNFFFWAWFTLHGGSWSALEFIFFFWFILDNFHANDSDTKIPTFFFPPCATTNWLKGDEVTYTFKNEYLLELDDKNSFNFRPDYGRPLKFIDRIVLRFLSLFLWPNICRRAHSYTFSPYIANRVNDKNVYKKRKRALIDVCHVPCRTWSTVVYTRVQVECRAYTLHSNARSRGYESSYSLQCCEGIRSL